MKRATGGLVLALCLVVAESAKQLEVDTGNAKLRRQFAEGFDDRLRSVREVLLRRAVPVMLVHTGEDAAEQVRQALGHRPPVSKV